MSNAVLRPDFGHNDFRFPPLPEICAPSTAREVFTHRSLHGRTAHTFENPIDDIDPDYEKLEHLGDAVLQMHITDLLNTMYPNLREGPATTIRSMIVGNDNLAKISLKYKLPDRLRAHPTQLFMLRGKTKVQADLFEAYVGGLYRERGSNGIFRWINDLFCPYAQAAYAHQREVHTVSAVPLYSQTSTSSSLSTTSILREPPDSAIQYTAIFNQHFQNESRQYNHRKIKSSSGGAIWYVTLQVNGILYGNGAGPSIKAACNEAAKQGLRSLGIIH